MTHLAIRLSQRATAAPRQGENEKRMMTPNPADVVVRAHQVMDRLSLSCEIPHGGDPGEDLDHLSLTSNEHPAESEDRWM
jgi:hypothetical protein